MKCASHGRRAVLRGDTPVGRSQNSSSRQTARCMLQRASCLAHSAPILMRRGCCTVPSRGLSCLCSAGGRTRDTLAESSAAAHVRTPRPTPLAASSHTVFLCALVDLAADVGKNDQYTYDRSGRNDRAYNDHPELHAKLYSDSNRHPDRRNDGIFGNVYYVLVCRAALGAFVVSRDGSTTVEGEDLFPFTDRELRPITGVSPPVHHHALIGDTGDQIDRYREFIVFHGDSLYPEYLLAYHRAA